jgi:hypothetical protein
VGRWQLLGAVVLSSSVLASGPALDLSAEFPLPAQMVDWHHTVGSLHRWQTLVGAAIGALTGILGAGLVAYLARRRERITAAVLIVRDTTAVKVANEVWHNKSKEEQVPDGLMAAWLVVHLLDRRPRLSPFINGAIAQMVAVDNMLAAHLSLFLTLYEELEFDLTRLSAWFQRGGRTGLPDPVLLAANYPKTQDIATHFATAVRHAECAEDLLQRLVLPRRSRWQWLKRRWYGYDKDCETLLQTGDLPPGGAS